MLRFDDAKSNTGSVYPKSSADIETMEACFTYADILGDQLTNIHSGLIGVVQAQALKRTVLIAILSTDALLNHQPGYLLFPDGTRIELAFLPNPACGSVGCYARAELSDSLLERIKAAKALSFGVDEATGRLVSTPLPCCGFAEVFGSQRRYGSARDERQRQLMLNLAPELDLFIRGGYWFGVF